MARSQKKDKKISILGRVKYKNELGETSYRFGPIPNGENIWAYYRQASAKEVLAAAQTTDYKIDAIFKINWRDDIDNTNEIRFRGKDYKINRIDDYEGYKKDLVIYAYLVE